MIEAVEKIIDEQSKIERSPAKWLVDRGFVIEVYPIIVDGKDQIHIRADLVNRHGQNTRCCVALGFMGGEPYNLKQDVLAGITAMACSFYYSGKHPSEPTASEAESERT